MRWVQFPLEGMHNDWPPILPDHAPPGRSGHRPGAPVHLDTPFLYPIGSDPGPPGVGDFNEDGHLDLAVAGRNPQGVILLLGSGGGQFTPEPALFHMLGDPPLRVLVADVNEDGHDDLVCQFVVLRRIHILFGDGAGSFPTTLDLGALPGGGRADSVFVLDLTGDDCKDLLVQASSRILTYVGDGAGGFAPPIVLVSTDSSFPRPGDFDEDGHQDVLMVSSDLVTGGYDVTLRFHGGNGTGNFPLSSSSYLGTYFQIRYLAVADVDNDQHLDAIAASTDGEILVALGDGSGQFTPHDTFTLQRYPNGMDLADMNEDGNVDIILHTDGRGSILFGDGQGNFAASDSFLIPGVETLGITVADVDEDGHLDILAPAQGLVGEDPTGISVLRGDGQGRLETSTGPLLSRAPPAIADLDEDGHVDLVRLANGDIQLLSGDGEGGFSVTSTSPGPGAMDGYAYGVLRLGDVQGDGHLDAVLLGARFMDRRVATLLGNGTGALVNAEVIDIDLPFLLHANLADLNGDGMADLTFGTVEGIHVLLADGQGGFAPPFVILPLSEVRATIAEDLDLDGLVDLAVVREDPDALSADFLTILIGDGLGGFQHSQDLAAADGAWDLVALHLDQDYAIDIFVTTRIGVEPDDIYVYGLYENLGDGLFAPGTFLSHPTECRFSWPVTGDFDGDGLTDIAVKCGSRLTILPGHPTLPRFEAEFDFPISLGSGGLLSADFDEDGSPDLLTFQHDLRPGAADELMPLFNRTRLYNCRLGNVNRGAGSRTDVLFVNDSSGLGREKRVFVERGSPLTIRVEAPPSATAMAPFVLYGYTRVPAPENPTDQPFGLGCTGMPIPLNAPPGLFSPRAIWKNINGFDQQLGTATHPSSPAPSTVVDLAAISVRGHFYFQGLILDSGAPNGQAAVMNGVELLIR